MIRQQMFRHFFRIGQAASLACNGANRGMVLKRAQTVHAATNSLENNHLEREHQIVNLISFQQRHFWPNFYRLPSGWNQTLRHSTREQRRWRCQPCEKCSRRMTVQWERSDGWNINLFALPSRLSGCWVEKTCLKHIKLHETQYYLRK